MPSVATIKTGTIAASGGTYDFQPAAGTGYLLTFVLPSDNGNFSLVLRDFTDSVSVALQTGANPGSWGTVESTIGGVPIGYASGWSQIGLRITNNSSAAQSFVLSLLKIDDVCSVVGKRMSIASGTDSGTTFRPPVGKQWIKFGLSMNPDGSLFPKMIRASDSAATAAVWGNGNTNVHRKPMIAANDYYPRFDAATTGTVFLVAIEMDASVSLVHGFVASGEGGGTVNFTPASGVKWLVLSFGRSSDRLIVGGISHLPATSYWSRLVIDETMSVRLDQSHVAAIVLDL